MSTAFGSYGYSRSAAPSIWVRDSVSGSPHQLITAAQNGSKTVRNRSGTTYSQIRQWCIADLKLAGARPQEISHFLRTFDTYFMRDIFPNIPEADRSRLLGTWSPPGGGS